MQIEEFLDNLTHQQKVGLAFQMMDYISTEMYISGDTITIVTKENEWRQNLKLGFEYTRQKGGLCACPLLELPWA